MTIREALQSAAERLESERISNPRLTAEVLLGHSLSVSREYLYAHNERILRDEEAESFQTALSDRVSGMPLQYIVGTQEFYGRSFRVTPSVLIPRPETEHIIESVLEILQTESNPSMHYRMMDVGTGSGCIAVTLALEIPNSEICAGDISEDALRIARENASRLNANVAFVCTDVLDAIAGIFDFIVSNPPYVAPGDFTRLQREVRDHEPRVALFAPGSPGDDGLQIYRRLIAGARERLRPSGYLLMEVGMGMEEKVHCLFGKEWKKLPTKTDLQGIPRTVIARYSPDTNQWYGEAHPQN